MHTHHTNNGSQMTDRHDNCLTHLIAQRAYQIWKMRKCQEGTALDDWLKAEREILARYMSGMIDRERLLAIKDAAITAIQRSRYVFLLINVSAIIIFAAEFNAMLPWIRHFKDNNADLLRELGVIAIPFIGVKTSVFDLQINAALAMLILAIWFWFALRRENHAIGLVVREARKYLWLESDRSEYLYHAVVEQFVFTTASPGQFGGRQEPICSSFESCLFQILKF